MADSVLDTALVAVGIAFAAALLALLSHAGWLAWYRHWSTPRLAAGRTALAGIVAGEPIDEARVNVVRGLTPGLQDRLVMDVSRSISGASRARLAEVADRAGITRRVEQWIQSGDWRRRLHGIRILSAFGRREEAVVRLLRDPHPAVRAEAAEWAADHPSQVVVSALLDLLTDPATLCRFTVQDSLLRLGSPTIGPLREYISSHDGAEVLPALEVAVGLAQPAFGEPAIRLCASDDAAVRGRAAELLGALGGERATEVLTGLLADGEPSVRAAAARALGRMGHWPGAPVVAKLLRDPEWQARYAAGLALREMGGPGVLLLRRSRGDADPEAAAVARRILDLPRREARA